MATLFKRVISSIDLSRSFQQFSTPENQTRPEKSQGVEV